MGLFNNSKTMASIPQYYGSDRIIKFEDNKYYLGYLNDYNPLSEAIECLIFKGTNWEEELAELLLDWNLPESIEEVVISSFNNIKKRILLHRDQVKVKKTKILQSYR